MHDCVDCSLLCLLNVFVVVVVVVVVFSSLI